MNHASRFHSPRVLATGLLALSLTFGLGASAQEFTSDEQVLSLATFELGPNHTAEFLGFPEDSEVAYIEIGRGDEAIPLFHQVGELATLDAFLVLAPDNAPLPRLLVDNVRRAAAVDAEAGDERAKVVANPSYDLDQLVRERGLVETLGTVSLDGASEGLKSRLTRYTGLDGSALVATKGGSWGTGSWNCAQSASDFAAFACSGSGGSGRIDFCHSGAYTGQLIHNSYLNGWRERKTSFGITAACNDSIDVAHDRYITGWKNKLHVTNLPSGFWMWHRFEGTTALERRVLHRTVFHTGFHRAYSAFYN